MTHEEIKQRRKEIAKLVKSGISMRDVAKKMDITFSSVYQACRDQGVGVMTREQKRQRRFDVAQDIKNGMTLERAAKKHGLCGNAVFQACKEHGINMTLRYRPKPTSAFKILKLLLDGMPPMEVAEKCEVTKQRVSQARIAARKAGFKV